MNEKQESPQTIEEINKKIVELKKKIQLSEGQRKAAFEEYESQRKENADEILKLKQEVKELTLKLQKYKDGTAAYRIRNRRLETIVGPLINKTVQQVTHALDLQIIDQRKQLDLVQYKIKNWENKLENLTKEYKLLLAERPKEELMKRLATSFKSGPEKCKKPKKELKIYEEKLEIATPYRKKCYMIQNNIHRIEVQWREAEHIRNSYKTIKATLLTDRAYFESTIQQLEEKKQAQDKEIQALQKMSSEAASIRAAARAVLEREERAANVANKARERQAADQLAKVEKQKAELEKLQKEIYLASKGAEINPTAIKSEEIDDIEKGEEVEEVQEEHNEEDEVVLAFDQLKAITGAKKPEEVLVKFQEQQKTRDHLEYLKGSTENEKRRLEAIKQAMLVELEKSKFEIEKVNDKIQDITEIKSQIEVQNERKEKLAQSLKEKRELLETICKVLYNLYTSFGNIGVQVSEEVTAEPKSAKVLIKLLTNQVKELVSKMDLSISPKSEDTGEESSIEETMPPSYNILFRETSLSEENSPTPDDDEESPSRDFLKHQAQLAIDTKTRRKALRFALSRK